MVTLKSGLTFYMDAKLKKNLDILLDACQQDDDMFIIFSGPEGAGKSVFMQQVGAYCADYLGTEFNIDNVVFSLREYLTKSIKSPHYTVINLDEARKILNKSAGATKESRTFTDYASECRSKRQVHIIGLPAYHDLNRYIVNWRMKMLIEVKKDFVVDESRKSGYALSRGTFKLYTNKEQINKYYEYKYNYPRQFESYGRFNNIDILDKDEYNNKKGENLEAKYDPDKQDEKEAKKVDAWKNKFIKLLKGLKEPQNQFSKFDAVKAKQVKISYRDVSQLTEIPETSLRQLPQQEM